MKYEDISKNGYPLGFLIKKVQDSSKNLIEHLHLIQGRWIYSKKKQLVMKEI